MEDFKLKKYLTKFINERPSLLGKKNHQRINQIKNAFNGDRNNLKKPFLDFIMWLSKNKYKIDSILLWGSYVDGRETNFSFSFFQLEDGKDKNLICGPSDFDALLVTNNDLTPPFFDSRYYVLDNDLAVRDIIHLNITRDVFIIKTDMLEKALFAREQKYLDCLLYAYFQNGLVLKNDLKINTIFKKFSNRKYWINPMKHMNIRLNLLKNYIE